MFKHLRHQEEDIIEIKIDYIIHALADLRNKQRLVQ